MAYATSQRQYSYFNPQMRGAFAVSALFHLGIFLLTVVGVPFIMHPPPDISIPISVEIVDIADVTTTNKVAKPVKKIENEETPPPKIEKPSPPEMAEETPPDVPKPPEPEVTQP